MKQHQIRQIIDVEFHRQDDFLIAIVGYASGMTGIGVTRRGPNDEWNEREARKIAVRRAQPIKGIDRVSLNAIERKLFG